MEDMFDFLDSLRESGQINMFGAAPVLVDVFEINKFEAREVLAACVVLTFVFVAIFIPIFPAKAEKKAPTTNEITIIQCVEGTIVETINNKTLTAITNKVNSLYSCLLYTSPSPRD